MLKFKKLELSDIDIIKPFLKYHKDRLCDCSIGGIFMWRDFFRTEFAICKDLLFFRVKYINGIETFTVPLGENIDEGFKILKEYCLSHGESLIFCTASTNDVKLIKSKFPIIESKAETDWFDYLYDASDLINMKGKKFSGQRNHINKFKMGYSNYEFKKISSEDLPKIKEYLLRISNQNENLSPTAIEESNKVVELIDNYETYNLFGGILLISDYIIGLSIGEKINDTLFVHIEKADLNYRGSYQIVVNEFAKLFATDEIKFINREEDVGDLGLRKSKLSYNPTAILEKFTVKATCCNKQ